MHYLPLGDAIRMGQVCRAWRATASDHSLWQSYTHYACGRLMPSVVMRQRFHLSRNEIEAVEEREYPMTLRIEGYRRPVRGYPWGDVQKASFVKHGGPPGLTRAHTKAESRLLAREAKRVERARLLESALRARHIEMDPTDECQKLYIDGSRNALTLDLTVETVVAMRFLHDHTEYPTLLAEAFDLLRVEALSPMHFERTFESARIELQTVLSVVSSL